MKKGGIFITFEGTDGVGKSTQIKLFRNWLHKNKIKLFHTREPGGGPAAEKIRRILLDPRVSLSGMGELFLYEAARVEHVNRTIIPALKKGKTVLCDRYTDATLAYQGVARKLGLGFVQEMNNWATGGLKPDWTILLDLPAHIGLKRARSRSKKSKGDRLENEGVRFQIRVRQGYLKVAKMDRSRIRVIPVQNSIQGTQNLIRHAFLKKWGRKLKWKMK